MKKIFIFIIMIVGFLPLVSFAIDTSPDLRMIPEDRIDRGRPTGLVFCNDPPNCNLSDLINTVNSAINFLVVISASIAAIMFITAGFLYMTAGGDTGKVGQAHKIFQATAIGFAIVVGGWLIIKMVISGLSIDPNFQNILPDNS